MLPDPRALLSVYTNLPSLPSPSVSSWERAGTMYVPWGTRLNTEEEFWILVPTPCLTSLPTPFHHIFPTMFGPTLYLSRTFTPQELPAFLLLQTLFSCSNCWTICFNDLSFCSNSKRTPQRNPLYHHMENRPVPMAVPQSLPYL